MKILRKSLPILIGLVVAICSAAAAAVEPTLYQLPDSTHAPYLANGPDGEVWFLGYQGRDGSAAFIGSYRADGKLTELALPARRFRGPLVVDPGEGFWLREGFRGESGGLRPRIAHISTGGDFTDYKLGERPGRVTGLAPLHGKVWFGASRPGSEPSGSIGRLDPATGLAETVVRLPLDCVPGAVASTSDAIVFVELCRRKLGSGKLRRAALVDRLDPATGGLTRLRLRHGTPRALVVGPDGSIWFGTSRTGFDSRVAGSMPTVDRISPAGKLSEHPAPGGRALGSAALGPEGRLWFPSAVPGHGYPVRGLNSIGPRGDLGDAFCISADCGLEPYGLLTRPDGSIWFGAGKTQFDPPSGSSGIAQEILTAEEGGFLGHFIP